MEDQRKEFVIAAQNCNNISALCRELGISRKTGYKWLKRYENGQLLGDRSRAPNTVANKTSSDMEERILRVRYDNPGWGAATIHRVLENAGVENLPCVKTVNNILNRHHCISAEESDKRRPFIRFQKEHCNDLWQTDFKGDFPLLDGNRCYPLDILDDCSRFLIKIVPSISTANLVIPSFEQAFYEYGMPDSILSDNGAQFAGFKQGYTQFEKWIMCLDILPIHGRIKHPQKQGKIERFHRTMKYELLNHKIFDTVTDADKALQEWRFKYNHLRPHEALHMRCPAEVYTPSQRSYTDIIKPYEYGGQYHVIKVNSWGYARFDKWQIYLSETMAGEYIEFRPNPLGDSFFACYRNFKIAEFSTVSGKLLFRNISRL